MLSFHILAYSSALLSRRILGFQTFSRTRHLKNEDIRKVSRLPQVLFNAGQRPGECDGHLSIQRCCFLRPGVVLLCLSTG